LCGEGRYDQARVDANRSEVRAPSASLAETGCHQALPPSIGASMARFAWRLALLHDEGRLATGDPLRHLSIVGSEFTGRVVEEVAGGVITEVEGCAHLTGRHEFVLEPEDELGEGFLLR